LTTVFIPFFTTWSAGLQSYALRNWFVCRFVGDRFYAARHRGTQTHRLFAEHSQMCHWCPAVTDFCV